MNLIKFWFIINAIKGLIKKISKFGADLGCNYKKLKSKDHSE
jgi:hypothetical protein